MALNTVVLADLLGVERLSSSFGIKLLFDGVVIFIGPPAIGENMKSILSSSEQPVIDLSQICHGPVTASKLCNCKATSKDLTDVYGTLHMCTRSDVTQ